MTKSYCWAKSSSMRRVPSTEVRKVVAGKLAGATASQRSGLAVGLTINPSGPAAELSTVFGLAKSISSVRRSRPSLISRAMASENR